MAAILKYDRDKITEFLRSNNAQKWFVSSAAERGANAKIWESNPEIGFDPNIQSMFAVLDTIESGTLYIHGCDNTNAKNNYDACFRIYQREQTPEKITGIQQPISAPIGYVGPEELKRQIDAAVADAVAREQFKAERAAFETERREFKNEKKEFQQARDGVIGLLVEKAAPVVLPYLNKIAPKAAEVAPAMVAGLDPDDYAPAADTDETAEIFSEQEADKLFELCGRWKKADEKDYTALLDKIVKFAESDKEIKVFGISLNYNKVKELLLNVEI